MCVYSKFECILLNTLQMCCNTFPLLHNIQTLQHTQGYIHAPVQLPRSQEYLFRLLGGFAKVKAGIHRATGEKVKRIISNL